MERTREERKLRPRPRDCSRVNRIDNVPMPDRFAAVDIPPLPFPPPHRKRIAEAKTRKNDPVSPFPARKPLVPAGERTPLLHFRFPSPPSIPRSGNRGKSRRGRIVFSSLRHIKRRPGSRWQQQVTNWGYYYRIGDRLIVRINSKLGV